MGWSSGQDLLIFVWDYVRDYVHDDGMRHELLKKLIKAFKKYDMDDCSDLEQNFPEAKAALKELYPHWYLEECSECEGKGIVPILQNFEDDLTEFTCPRCKGKGVTDETTKED